MTALVSFDRVFEVLDLKPLIEDVRAQHRSCLRNRLPGQLAQFREQRRSSSTMPRSATRPRPRYRSRRWSPLPCQWPSARDARLRVLHDVSSSRPPES